MNLEIFFDYCKDLTYNNVLYMHLVYIFNTYKKVVIIDLAKKKISMIVFLLYSKKFYNKASCFIAKTQSRKSFKVLSLKTLLRGAESLLSNPICLASMISK